MSGSARVWVYRPSPYTFTGMVFVFAEPVSERWVRWRIREHFNIERLPYGVDLTPITHVEEVIVEEI